MFEQELQIGTFIRYLFLFCSQVCVKEGRSQLYKKKEEGGVFSVQQGHIKVLNRCEIVFE